MAERLLVPCAITNPIRKALLDEMQGVLLEYTMRPDPSLILKMRELNLEFMSRSRGKGKHNKRKF